MKKEFEEIQEQVKSLEQKFDRACELIGAGWKDPVGNQMHIILEKEKESLQDLLKDLERTGEE